MKRSEVDLGTEQTRKRVRSDPIDYMVRNWGKNYRDISQIEYAARDIRRMFMLAAGGLIPRATNWQRSTGAPTALPALEWAYLRRRAIYLPWVREIGWKHSIVMLFLIDEMPLSKIDKRMGKRKGTAKDIIIHCFTRYAQISGNLTRMPTIS